MSMAPAEANSSDYNDEIDLLELGRRIWAGRYWVGLFALIAACVGLIIAAGTPPTYRADALLQLEEKSGQLALPESLAGLTGDDPRSAAEIEILRSRLVLGRAVADAHLDWVAEPRRLPLVLNALAVLGVPLPETAWLNAYARAGETIGLDLLEVPAHWLSDPIELTVGENGDYEVSLPDGTVLAGKTGESMIQRDRGFALRVGDLTAASGRVFSLRHLTEAQAISALRKRLTVSERGRQTNILELGMVSGNRDHAAQELRAVTDAYLRQNIARSSAEAQSSLDFIESQLPAAEADVREAEAALNDYRSEAETIDLGFEAQSLLTQITGLEADLRQLATQEDEISEKYTRNHPIYQQLLGERARLEQRLSELRGEIGSLPKTQREVLNLTRDLEIAQEVYVQLLNRSQELRVLKASTIGNVRIVDQARTAPEPVAPARSRIFALAVLLGLIAGIAFVLIKAMLRRGIQDAQDIEAAGLPVFSTITFVPGIAKHKKRKGDLPLLALTDPNDLAVEGLRSLRTSLHFGMLDAKNRSVAITSPAPNAGKSFVSANLGVIAAQTGQRVCLIDADLRMGHLRRYFGVPKVHLGLSDYLAGKATLDDILVDGPVPGLSVILTGQFPPNPSELLMRSGFDELIRELDTRFDLTIVDTPPVLAVTDPLIVSRSVGATIVLARFDETPVREIEAVQKHYLNAGLRLSGAILNGFDPKRVGANSYGYSYRYAYGEQSK